MGDSTILIVDDEPANLLVLSQTLSGIYDVRAANSGGRALQVAKSAPRPDLILLDFMMQDMDGYSVLAELKSNQATHNIPVIFVTAMETAEDEEKGLELGAVDCIMKPVRPAILLARVKAHLMFKQACWVVESNFIQLSQLDIGHEPDFWNLLNSAPLSKAVPNVVGLIDVSR